MLAFGGFSTKAQVKRVWREATVPGPQDPHALLGIVARGEAGLGPSSWVGAGGKKPEARTIPHKDGGGGHTGPAVQVLWRNGLGRGGGAGFVGELP